MSSAARNMTKVTVKSDVVADPMALWDAVCKTNPDYTKPVNNGGYSFTTVSPQYQIKQATEQFGSYGSTWGLKDITRDLTTLKDIGLVIFSAVFYYPGGDFEISTSISLYKDKKQTSIDTDFCKKAETDMMTKSLSKIGFNADVFMGRFDDVRYVQEMKDEFNKPQTLTRDQQAQIHAFLKAKGIPPQSLCQAWQIPHLAEIHDYNFQPVMDWIEQQPVIDPPQVQPMKNEASTPAKKPVPLTPGHANDRGQRARELQAMANDIVAKREALDRDNAQQARLRQDAVEQRRHEEYAGRYNDPSLFTPPPTSNSMEDGPTGPYTLWGEDEPQNKVLKPFQIKEIHRHLHQSRITEQELCRAAQVETLGLITQDNFPRTLEWIDRKAQQIRAAGA